MFPVFGWCASGNGFPKQYMGIRFVIIYIYTYVCIHVNGVKYIFQQSRLLCPRPRRVRDRAYEDGQSWSERRIVLGAALRTWWLFKCLSSDGVDLGYSNA